MALWAAAPASPPRCCWWCAARRPLWQRRGGADHARQPQSTPPSLPVAGWLRRGRWTSRRSKLGAMTHQTVTLRRRRGAQTLQSRECEETKVRGLGVTAQRPRPAPLPTEKVSTAACAVISFIDLTAIATPRHDTTRPAKQSYLCVSALDPLVSIHGRRRRG